MAVPRLMSGADTIGPFKYASPKDSHLLGYARGGGTLS